MNRMEDEQSFISGQGSQSQGSSNVTGKAREQVQRVRGQAHDFAEEGRERVAQRVEGVARAIERTGWNLSEENEPMLARYAADTAERVHKFSEYLSGHQIDDWIGELETFARRQPVWFLSGAFALGLAASRFVKSSQSRQSQSYDMEELETPGAPEPLIARPVVPVTGPPSPPTPPSPPPYGEGL